MDIIQSKEITSDIEKYLNNTETENDVNQATQNIDGNFINWTDIFSEKPKAE